MRQKLIEIYDRHPLGVVFIFLAICLLPVMVLRDFTPTNELKYLSIADEAIANGNFFAFYNHGIPYADKPPLYFWIIMLCRVIFGRHSMLALSLFSFIPALVIIWIMDKWVRLESSSDRGAAALMLATSAMFVGTAVFVRMDMLMTMFIVLALWSFYRMYEGEADYRKQSVLMPVWIFLALFTKGPVGLLMPPVVILCFLLAKKDMPNAEKYLGWKTWGIIAGLTALWILGAWLDGGKEYIDNLLFHQTLDRAVNAFHHKKPFWFYFTTLSYLTAPYCVLTLGAFIASLWKIKAGADRRSDSEILFLCAIASVFVMLSAFSSKLSIYMLPIIPFMVYLFPEVERRTGWKKWMGWTLGAGAGILAVAGIGGLAALTIFKRSDLIASLLGDYSFALNSALPVVAFAVVAALNILALVHLVKGRRYPVPTFLIATSMLLAAYILTPLVRETNKYTSYGTVCEGVPDDTKVVTLFMMHSENMDAYLGRSVTNYGKDVNKFASDNFGSGDTQGKVTLLTRSERVETIPALKKIADKNTVFYSGPFCVITYDPGAVDSSLPSE